MIRSPNQYLTDLAGRNLENHAGMSTRLLLRHFKRSISTLVQRVKYGCWGLKKKGQSKCPPPPLHFRSKYYVHMQREIRSEFNCYNIQNLFKILVCTIFSSLIYLSTYKELHI